jgi:hypothetical protein
MRTASTGRPRRSAASMLIPASSSSDKLNPIAGSTRLAPLGYTGRGGRRRCQGLLAIAKNWCQSFLSHIDRAPASWGLRTLVPTPYKMRRQPSRSLSLVPAPRFEALPRLPSGIRHIPSGVHNRLENVSAALRKRNYRLRANAEYRLANEGSRSNELTRLETTSSHLKRARKPLLQLCFGKRCPAAQCTAARQDFGQRTVPA